ncbi:MAG: hypothetical protein K6L74_02510 [Neptuniibacter sp.]
MLSKFKCVLAAATLLVASTGANAGAVSTIGNVSESGGVYTITTGTGSVSDSALETFGGFYAGALDAEMGTDVTEGSAIKSTIEVEAGDTLSFDWVWDTDDYLPFNDFAFVGLSLLGIEEVLASVAISGDYGTTSGSYSWTAGAAGVLTYVIGVVDVGDTAVTSYLNVSKLSPVPVPAAALLFGSALLGFAGFSARRKVS